jgi:hypothetical protein
VFPCVAVYPLRGVFRGVRPAGCGFLGGVGCVLFLVSRAGRALFAPVMGVPFGGGGCAGVMGLLVENCIVDASILKRSNF